MKKKIVLLIDDLGSGGAQTQVKSLAKHFSNDYEVFVVIYSSAKFNIPHCLNKNIYQLSRNKLFFIFQFIYFLKINKIDSVISFLDGPSILANLSCMFLKNINVIYSERFEFRPYSNFKLNLLYWLIYKRTNGISVNSYHQLDKAKYLFPTKNVVFTPNIYDSSLYDDIQTDNIDLDVTDRFNLTPNKINILVVSSLSEKKNPYFVCEFLLYLKNIDIQLYNNLKITWVGTYHVSGYSNTLFNKCVDFCNYNNIKIIDFIGEVSTSPSFYKKFDILLHPSLKEGFSNVVAESMLSGCYSILNNIGDHHIFSHLDSVSLFDDFPSLHNSINNYVLNKDTLKNKNANVKQSYLFIKNNYNIEKSVNSFKELL